MILTGPEIRREVAEGRITIRPFDEARLNPNSYNYCLGPLVLPLGGGAEPGDPAPWIDLRTAPLTLLPGRLYLGQTAERIGSRHYVAMLNGRSSMGRLGMFLNLSADLGQLGPAHQWTLEIKVVQPLTVYHGMKVGQATFWLPQGARTTYQGEYARKDDPTPCLDGRWQP